MTKVILQRMAKDSASPDDVEELVTSIKGSVLHRNDDMILAGLTDAAQLNELRGKLPGWLVSPQGPPIPVPDTRLKIRSAR